MIRRSPTPVGNEPSTTLVNTWVVSRGRLAVAVSASLVIVFLAIVAFLRGFKPEAAGFHQSGSALLLYHVFRLALAVYTTIVCYSAGYWALELLRRDGRDDFRNRRSTFIMCFFLGASLYGIIFSVLGLFGMISLSSSLTLTVPILALSYRPLGSLCPERFEDITRPLTHDTHSTPLFASIAAAGALTFALLFLVTRIVFIPAPDGNVWEHYLHYYRAVLASGSTAPNEVWHHFYNSKGGGLVFLVNVLSDFFGVQLVSGCFVFVAGLIILDLLLTYCQSATWAFFGVAVFFSNLYGDAADGAMFRVHGVLLGYASFLLWGSMRLQEANARQGSLLLAALVISLAYLGFYLPVATALFPLGFVLVIVASGKLRDRRLLTSFVIMTGALVTGTAVDVVTNWMMTGLPELTPIRWLWAIADRGKVETVFGTGGIDFFLAVNNDLMGSLPWLERIDNTIRRPLSGVMMDSTFVAAAALVAVVVRHRRDERLRIALKFLGQVAAFIAPLALFVIVIPSPSVYRMGMISLVFTVLAIVVTWKSFVDVSVGRLAFPLVTVDEGGEKIGQRSIRLWHVATIAIVVWGIASTVPRAEKNLKHEWPIIGAYAMGATSLEATLRAMESRYQSPPGTSVAAMLEFQKTAAGTGRVLSLVYDPGYAYLLPAGGIVSEPTYALIRNRAEIFAKTADGVAGYLRERNISHLALSLRRPLFSTIAFTALFDPDEMRKHFSVVYEDGDFFILTWRSPQGDQPADRLIQLFELKRTGALHYPFSRHFAAQMLTGNHVLMNHADFETIRDMFGRRLETVLRTDVLPSVSVKGGKDLLLRAWEAGRDEMRQANPAVGVSERQVQERLLRRFLETVYDRYVEEIGLQLATLAAECDERVPFAMSYPSDAACGSPDPMIRQLLRARWGQDAERDRKREASFRALRR
jgi:hypothetical protein